LFDPLANVPQDPIEIGTLYTDLALNVEQRFVEERSELGSVVPRNEDGLAEEFGSERGSISESVALETITR
jgi:hypothetical protein